MRYSIILWVIVVFIWSCSRRFPVHESADYNRFIYNNEMGEFAFWNDTVGVTFIPDAGTFCYIGVKPVSISRKRSKALDIKNGKLLARFICKEYWPENKTLSYPLYLSEVISAANERRFLLHTKKKYGDLIARYANALQRRNVNAVARVDDWFDRVEVIEADSSEREIGYLPAFHFLEDNLHWQQVKDSVARNEFQEMYLLSAAQLHKLPSIRKVQRTRSHGYIHDEDLKAVSALVTASGHSEKNAYIKALCQAIGENRLVMFNEHHHDWRNRALTRSMLAGLKGKGFTVLALESLTWDDDINNKKFPTYHTGYYSRESEMADLMRTASNMGFTLLPYEDTVLATEKIQVDDMAVDSREWEQAKNIQKILATHPGEKLVVHAGFSHIAENYSSCYGGVTMAEVLRRKFDIDPFTVEQTFLNDLEVDLHPAMTDIGYFLVDKKRLMDIDSCLFSQCDAYLYNNINYYPKERNATGDAGAHWLNLRALELEKKVNLSGLQSVLELYVRQELVSLFPIPVYIKHIMPSSNSRKTLQDFRLPEGLWLVPGEYQLQLKDHGGRVYFKQVIALP